MSNFGTYEGLMLEEMLIGMFSLNHFFSYMHRAWEIEDSNIFG